MSLIENLLDLPYQIDLDRVQQKPELLNELARFDNVEILGNYTSLKIRPKNKVKKLPKKIIAHQLSIIEQKIEDLEHINFEIEYGLELTACGLTQIPLINFKNDYPHFLKFRSNSIKDLKHIPQNTKGLFLFNNKYPRIDWTNLPNTVDILHIDQDQFKFLVEDLTKVNFTPISKIDLFIGDADSIVYSDKIKSLTELINSYQNYLKISGSK